MQTYLDLLQHVLDHGTPSSDRTGTGTVSVFGTQSRYDLKAGFPLVTTKKVFWKGVVAELLWFLSGDTNAKTLQAQGVHIWDAWSQEDGSLGPVYGKQWVSWGPRGINQIQQVVDQIRSNPSSRRLIVSAWNPEDLEQMALPPCHLLFQFYVRDGKLSCQLYQRSADLFLGVPFNIASYALLTHMIAHVCGLDVGEFVHTIGDAHIYLNHMDQVREQLARPTLALPRLELAPGVTDIFAFRAEDIKLVNYQSLPAIKAPVAV